ncbi:hypothetical protein L6452_01690 [Arctium lappa]|uniref:Uncharacterized protein n=1 Tax=Arctium lappa TaxID=4217 RepID=A0ACB9FIE1_ARCLA|nr:hypothetical protein L6452_01690 [Arctium lappa]
MFQDQFHSFRTEFEVVELDSCKICSFRKIQIRRTRKLLCGCKSKGRTRKGLLTKTPESAEHYLRKVHTRRFHSARSRESAARSLRKAIVHILCSAETRNSHESKKHSSRKVQNLQGAVCEKLVLAKFGMRIVGSVIYEK